MRIQRRLGMALVGAATSVLAFAGPASAAVITGTSGDDTIIGASEVSERIYGGGGNDHLYGQLGMDTFVFAPHDGNDVIHDFVSGIDKINLAGSFGVLLNEVGEVDIEQWLSTASVLGPDLMLHLDEGQNILLKNTISVNPLDIIHS